MTTATMLPDTLPPLRLIQSRDYTARRLAELINAGREIKSLRLKSQLHLDRAREAKLSWCQQVSEELTAAFGDGAAAEYFGDWSPQVLPEYAPVEAFIEAFYAEVNHRLQRLKMLLKQVSDSPEPRRTPPTPQPVAPASTPSHSSASHASHAPSEVRPPAPHKIKESTPMPTKPPRTLLIQCGMDDGAKTLINTFCNQLGLELASTCLQPEQAQALPQQLEEHRDASFAIFHFAPTAASIPEAEFASLERYLVFAMGYAVGRFGAGRVAMLGATPGALLPGQAPLPAMPLDSAGGWQLHLARHLKRAGIEVDLNRLC